MNEAHENSNEPEKLAQTGGQLEFLCDETASRNRLSITYEPVVSPDGDDKISKAFDLLFQEVMSIKKSKPPHEISRHIRQGFNRPAGRRAND